MDRPNEKLLELIFLALDHGISSVEGTDGPLIPIAIVEASNGERTLARFTTGANPDEARQHARAFVEKSADCSKYAIAADGTLTEDGHKVPVIMVEAGQRGEPNGFCMIQRFSSTKTCRFARPERNPGIIAERQNA